ncbi:MAG: hypothetical protein JWQ22_1757 [Devosia sp.]|nr:hypothetical protein [Devosia sp.]
MKTAAENYLFDSEDKIGTARDYLIVASRMLERVEGLSYSDVGALSRLVDTILHEVKSLEADMMAACMEYRVETGLSM